jgi:hypothetical protein
VSELLIDKSKGKYQKAKGKRSALYFFVFNKEKIIFRPFDF